MIECIFTIDYEIYGNGEGSLRELVSEPAERLAAIFREHEKKFVAFVEAAELEVIGAGGTDPAIEHVKAQIRDFHREGFEIGLHLHPQWYNAKRQNGRWQLDHEEYNLCTLPQARIAEIVDRAIAWLRRVTGAADYAPLAFRAGNWLFQPAQPAAGILADRGVKVDSSVFKGGMRHEHGLDYSRALRNGYYWTFSDAADVPDQKGSLTELPIYTRMVPFWRLLNSKRIGMEQKGSSGQTGRQRLYRLMDLLRFAHPLKLDFCRMTIDDLTGMMEEELREDRKDPSVFRPIAAIGHTKELIDFETVERFLLYLENRGVKVSTFQEIYSKLTVHS
jgi:hypothetical protein